MAISSARSQSVWLLLVKPKNIVYNKKSRRKEERKKTHSKMYHPCFQLYSFDMKWTVHVRCDIYICELSKTISSTLLKIILKNLILTAVQWTKTRQTELTAHWKSGKEWPMTCGRLNDDPTLLFLLQQKCNALHYSNSRHLFTCMLYKTKLAITYKHSLHFTTLTKKN